MMSSTLSSDTKMLIFFIYILVCLAFAAVAVKLGLKRLLKFSPAQKKLITPKVILIFVYVLIISATFSLHFFLHEISALMLSRIIFLEFVLFVAIWMVIPYIFKEKKEDGKIKEEN